MAGRRLALLIALCAGVAVCAATAEATTIVPMSDRNLTLSVRAIVEGVVVDAEPVWDADRGAVYTYVTIDVEQTYRGDVPPGLVVLRQLGGITSEHATVIYGAPELRPGEQVLLFLNADADGAMHVAHLSLGLFRVETDAATGAVTVARPSFAESLSPVTREPVTSRAPRDAFVAELLATLSAAGEETSAAAAHPAPPLQIVPSEFAAAAGHGARPGFTFLGSGFRWFEPDTGQKVRVKVNSARAPTPSGGVDEASAAFGAWSSVPGSRLREVYDGSTHAGGIKSDGVTAVSFGDPLNQIDDLVGCQGVLAISGLSADPGQQVTIRGKTFARITESDLVVNNGIECVLAQWPPLFQEILTHESGHGVGLGHSSEKLNEPDPVLRDATMYFVAHNDGRGASIRQDDSDGIRFLYGVVPGPLTFATVEVPDAMPNESYTFDLKAQGGAAPYTWSLAGGALPQGLSLGANGLISGTPSREGTATFAVRVTDAAGGAQQRSFVLRVTGTPAPFLAAAEYLDGKRKLQLTGRYLDVTAIVTVNGVRVVPPAIVRYKSRKMRLLVSGSASNFGLRGDGSDTVSVAIGGRASNTVRF